MARCCRHLKALLKKNMILWYRNPCCAFFEIFSPFVLMIILAAIRAQIPVTPTDAAGMLDKKQVSTLGAAFYDGKWAKKKKSNKVNYNKLIDGEMRILTTFADYKDREMKKDPDAKYSIANDWFGP